MKYLAPYALLVLVCIQSTPGVSQIGNKPSQFSNFPDVINCTVTELDKVFSLSSGQHINLSFSDNFIFDGAVTGNTVKFSNPFLDGTWRLYAGQKYLFVLNMSSATLTGLPFTTPGLSGIGKLQVFGEQRTESLSLGMIDDTFTPYQLHVYTTAGLSVGSGGILPPVGTGTPVPEPTSLTLVAAGVASGLMKRHRPSRS